MDLVFAVSRNFESNQADSPVQVSDKSPKLKNTNWHAFIAIQLIGRFVLFSTIVIVGFISRNFRAGEMNFLSKRV